MNKNQEIKSILQKTQVSTQQPHSEVSKSGSKFSRNIWIVIIFILLLLVIEGIYDYKLNNDRRSGNDQQVGITPKPTPLPTSTPKPFKPIDSGAWTILILKDEMLTKSALAEDNLIYATKSGYISTVYKKNLQSGNEDKIFEFIENWKASNSGNHWEGSPPNMALSPDKKQIAFTDREGLKSYDLQSKNTKVFIYKVARPTGDIENKPPPPQWSESSLNGKNFIYNLANPQWSSDGKYITFSETQYEGMSMGAIEAESGNYISTLCGGWGCSIAWSPLGHTYAMAYSVSKEISISSSGNIAEKTDISGKLGITDSHWEFDDVNFSSDGQKIVFIVDMSSKVGIVAVANIDGTGFTVLDSEGYAMPFFSLDVNSIFVIQERGDRRVLVEINIATKKAVDYAVLPSGLDVWKHIAWTKDGYLVLQGSSSVYKNGLNVGKDKTRLLILDLQNKSVVYASPVYNWSTNFAGFSN